MVQKTWLVATKYLQGFFPAVLTIKQLVISASGLVGALAVVGGAGIATWQWFVDPHDSRISVVYAGIGATPEFSVIASNNGTRPGSVTEAQMMVAWVHDGKPHGLAFALRIDQPKIIEPRQPVPITLPIWSSTRPALGPGTTQEDVAALLTPDDLRTPDDLTRAPIAHAECAISYHVINTSGKTEDKKADVGECGRIAYWIKFAIESDDRQSTR
jgi:hypothetical protein